MVATHTSKGEKGVGGFFAKIFSGKSGERSDVKKQDDLDGVCVCVCVSTVSCVCNAELFLLDLHRVVFRTPEKLKNVEIVPLVPEPVSTPEQILEQCAPRPSSPSLCVVAPKLSRVARALCFHT